MVFAGYSGFLHYLQVASHELATIGINVTKNKIPNPNPLDNDSYLTPMTFLLLTDTHCFECNYRPAGHAGEIPDNDAGLPQCNLMTEGDEDVVDYWSCKSRTCFICFDKNRCEM